MRFASLGSGSRGNATVVQGGADLATTVLIDCGFSAAETTRRLERLGLAGGDIDAILVTHEHSDHIGGVARFARRYGVQVLATSGTLDGMKDQQSVTLSAISPHEKFSVNDLEIQPFPVPHDAREPCQFVLSDGARKLGVLSDVGEITAHIRSSLTACDALFVETNHDANILAAGPYPDALKDRVGGRLGHLNNEQTGDLMAGLGMDRLQHLLCGHLSEQNNSPELARTVVAQALGCEEHWIGMADQNEGFSWRQIA